MKLIVANWKSNKNRSEVEHWMDKYEEKLVGSDMSLVDSKLSKEVEVVIAPPMPSLMFVSNRLLNPALKSFTKLGVQDISPYPAGKYTGGVSAYNLQGFNVKYAIVGHSERRRYFRETSQMVAQKVDQCLDNDITPIICVDTPYLLEQLKAISPQSYSKCVVAYEPLEAIGSGQSDDPKHVKTIVERIKKLMPKTRVIYGGSATPKNVNSYLEVSDGVLVGEASLDVGEFVNLVMLCNI